MENKAHIFFSDKTSREETFVFKGKILVVSSKMLYEYRTFFSKIKANKKMLLAGKNSKVQILFL